MADLTFLTIWPEKRRVWSCPLAPWSAMLRRCTTAFRWRRHPESRAASVRSFTKLLGCWRARRWTRGPRRYGYRSRASWPLAMHPSQRRSHPTKPTRSLPPLGTAVASWRRARTRQWDHSCPRARLQSGLASPAQPSITGGRRGEFSLCTPTDTRMCTRRSSSLIPRPTTTACCVGSWKCSMRSPSYHHSAGRSGSRRRNPPSEAADPSTSCARIGSQAWPRSGLRRRQHTHKAASGCPRSVRRSARGGHRDGQAGGCARCSSRPSWACIGSHAWRTTIPPTTAAAACFVSTHQMPRTASATSVQVWHRHSWRRCRLHLSPPQPTALSKQVT